MTHVIIVLCVNAVLYVARVTRWKYSWTWLYSSISAFCARGGASGRISTRNAIRSNFSPRTRYVKIEFDRSRAVIVRVISEQRERRVTEMDFNAFFFFQSLNWLPFSARRTCRTHVRVSLDTSIVCKTMRNIFPGRSVSRVWRGEPVVDRALRVCPRAHRSTAVESRIRCEDGSDIYAD